MQQLFNFPTDELKKSDTTYVSIAQNLHEATITNDKDRIQLENLLSEAEKKLKGSDLPNKDALMEQLEVVLRNRNELVNHTGALMIFITPDDIYYYHLAVPVKDQVQIGDIPFVLPLAEHTQYVQDYHLLSINRESARLFEGHGRYLRDLDMTEFDEEAPVDLETALGTEKEGGSQTMGTYSAGAGGSFVHGHTETSQEKDIDRERYFRIVDRFVYEHYSSKTKWPLVLYTVEENQSVFRSISNNQYLSDVEIVGSAANMKTTEIEKNVADKITELIDKQKQDSLRNLEEVSPVNRIENIPDDLTAASLQGQIDTLYLEKFFDIQGTITEEGLYDPDSDKGDFMNLLVHNVINTGGKVYIYDEGEMPNGQQIIARLRF